MKQAPFIAATTFCPGGYRQITLSQVYRVPFIETSLKLDPSLTGSPVALGPAHWQYELVLRLESYIKGGRE